MRQRSNLIILFGIAFFLVGGAIAYLVLNDDDGGGSASSGDGVAEVSVFVATQDIPAGTLGTDVIEQGLLETEQVPAASQPVGALTSAAGLDNQIFAVGVSEGDVITSAQLATRSLSNVSIPEGFDGVAVTIDYTNGGAAPSYVATSPPHARRLYPMIQAASWSTAPRAARRLRAEGRKTVAVRDRIFGPNGSLGRRGSRASNRCP